MRGDANQPPSVQIIYSETLAQSERTLAMGNHGQDDIVTVLTELR